MQGTGLGDKDARLWVCIGSQPDVPLIASLNGIEPLQHGDIAHIVAETGNHWRKIFNIFAKLMFAIAPAGTATWQQYRDEHLLQAGQHHALLFSPPQLPTAASGQIVLVTGKQYAEQLGLLTACDELERGFYRHRQHPVWITPYFDYRQLSNARLEYLLRCLTE